MKILLVEDDEKKRLQVIDELQSWSAHEVTMARSLNSGLAELESQTWDLVILDMSIPAFDINTDEPGGSPQALGGRDLLHHMRRLKIATPVVVLTQYDQFGDRGSVKTLDELNNLLEREHGAGYLGAIFFNVVYDEWRELLARVVRDVESKGAK